MGRKITVLVTQIFITAFLMKAKKKGGECITMGIKRINYNIAIQKTSMQSLKQRIERRQIQMNTHSMIPFT